MARSVVLSSLLMIGTLLRPSVLPAQALEGTTAWTDRGDPATAMVEQLHRFLDKETAASVERRAARWNRDSSSPEAYAKSIEPNRQRLRQILGAVDPRAKPSLERVVVAGDPPCVAETDKFAVSAVRWKVYDDFDAEGLLFEPKGETRGLVVLIGDAATPPEQTAGFSAEGKEQRQAAVLASEGCMVLIPTLLDRTDTFSGNPAVRMTNLTHREWIYRMSYEVGRHPIGYEVDEVRAAIDWFRRDGKPERPVGVIGRGEGGRVALYAAALDPRIAAVWVVGAFGPRESTWSEPIDRNIWSLLTEFGDAEVATLIAPRWLVVDSVGAPIVAGKLSPRDGRDDAASGTLGPIDPQAAKTEADRARDLAFAPLKVDDHLIALEPGQSTQRTILQTLGLGSPNPPTSANSPNLADGRHGFSTTDRQKRIIDGMTRHTQALIRTSELRRYAYWSKADRTNAETWDESTPPYRTAFAEELIGRLPSATDPLSARTIKLFDEPKWVGYGVEIPVWPGVVASGILLLPRDLQPGEKRPVVVCQHGLEGRPEDTVDPRLKTVYHAFGAQLADRGYIVYAPQNPYIGHDRFRQLQRKANPLKLSLFSIINRQHERTLEWLSSRPEVDPERIAFYGLSYGGKSAMRIPAELTQYCLSICSADFNEWVVKCTNLDRSYSYMFTIEYDMYEFGLAERFNYAEMAALVAPRPFMVERGHEDGVAPDEWVAYEFAKVKRLYDNLGIGDRTGLALFNGGHQIEGKETFRFLAEHLNWPRGATGP